MPTVGPATGAISHGLHYFASLHAVGLLLLQSRAANILLAIRSDQIILHLFQPHVCTRLIRCLTQILGSI